MVAYAVTVVSIIVVVLSENRSPVKSLAWVTVLLLLPAVGIVLYLFFGRSIKNTRMISRRNRRRLRRQEEAGKKLRLNKLDVSPSARLLIKLTRSLTGSLPYSGNDIRVFLSGKAKFDALIDDILHAEKFINMQYYIIDDDSIGTRVKDALLLKAAEGVKVRIIYDHVGSYRTSRAFFKELKHAGVKVFPFFEVVFPPFGTRINWRNHRKICIIDGKVGYIGGMNIAERYITGGHKFATWRDTHLRIFGPAVASLQYSFAVDWNFMGQPLIEEDMPTPAEFGNLAPDNVMQLLTAGPTSQWTNIAMLFVRAIASAKRRVFIQTPYFLPTEALLRALQSAALSGVDVRVMMPVRSDSRLLTAASASYINECLKSGMKIYLYNA
ncbi:MAG: cardiolipin synthase [Muribaculaceae bacterium]|nr:cardiolipin synthase [Muribaculaceae bacterium]